MLISAMPEISLAHNQNKLLWVYIPLENQSTFQLKSIPHKLDGKWIKKESFTDNDKYVYETRNHNKALHFRS